MEELPAVFEAELTCESLRFLMWVHDTFARDDLHFVFFAAQQKFCPAGGTPESALKLLAQHESVSPYVSPEDEPPGSIATVHVYGKLVEEHPSLSEEKLRRLQDSTTRSLWFKDMQLPSADAVVEGIAQMLVPGSGIGGHMEVVGKGVLFFRLTKSRLRQLQTEVRQGMHGSVRELLGDIRERASVPFRKPLRIRSITNYCQNLNAADGLQLKYLPRDKCLSQGLTLIPRARGAGGSGSGRASSDSQDSDSECSEAWERRNLQSMDTQEYPAWYSSYQVFRDIPKECAAQYLQHYLPEKSSEDLLLLGGLLAFLSHRPRLCQAVHELSPDDLDLFKRNMVFFSRGTLGIAPELENWVAEWKEKK